MLAPGLVTLVNSTDSSRLVSAFLQRISLIFSSVIPRDARVTLCYISSRRAHAYASLRSPSRFKSVSLVLDRRSIIPRTRRKRDKAKLRNTLRVRCCSVTDTSSQGASLFQSSFSFFNSTLPFTRFSSSSSLSEISGRRVAAEETDRSNGPRKARVFRAFARIARQKCFTLFFFLFFSFLSLALHAI